MEIEISMSNNCHIVAGKGIVFNIKKSLGGQSGKPRSGMIHEDKQNCQIYQAGVDHKQDLVQESYALCISCKGFQPSVKSHWIIIPDFGNFLFSNSKHSTNCPVILIIGGLYTIPITKDLFGKLVTLTTGF